MIAKDHNLLENGNNFDIKKARKILRNQFKYSTRES